MTSIADALQEFLRSKAKSSGDRKGNYARSSEYVIEGWIEWLDEEHDIVDLADVDVQTMRRWARSLKQQANEGEIAGSTANTYYGTVRAFLTWCVREELIDKNPALANRAEEELPDDLPAKEEQQFWTAEQRDELVRSVDERASAAIDEHGFDAHKAVRDRGLVYVLAFTGVRGGEVLRDPNDARRDGLRWRDVDAEADPKGTIRVLGKNQEYQHAPLPERVIPALERIQSVLQPPSRDWPVFPTFHAPTLHAHARSALQEQGLDEDAIDAALEGDVLDAFREHDIAPPALTTSGGRSVMVSLCQEADLDLDDGFDYLQPHGGRRGLGEMLYWQSSEDAQDALRHQSIETTHDSYAKSRAGETSRTIEDALGTENGSRQNRPKESE